MVRVIKVVTKITTLFLALLLVSCNGTASSVNNSNTNSATRYPYVLGYTSGGGVISTTSLSYTLTGNQESSGMVGINGSISLPTPSGILTMAIEPVGESTPLNIIESGLPVVNLPQCELNIINVEYLSCSFTITSTASSTINGSYNIIPTFTLLSTGEAQQLNPISVIVTNAANPVPGNLTITPITSSLIPNESTSATISLTGSIGIFESITVSLTSSNPNILTVTPSTCNITTINTCQVSVTAISAGSANIIATSPNYSESQATIAAAMPTTYAYVTNAGGTISMYGINENDGQLVPLNQSSVNSVVNANQVAIDNSNKYLYVSDTYHNSILMYGIESTTGILYPLNPSSVATNNNPTYIKTSSNGYLYVVTLSPISVSMYSINSSNGQLTGLVPLSIVAGKVNCEIAIDPASNYLYTLSPNSSLSSILMYEISSSTGELSFLAPESINSTANLSTLLSSVTIDPLGKYLYVSNGNNTVSGYAIPNTGILEPTGQQIATGNGPGNLITDRTGSYLYSLNYYDNSISMYSIDRNTGLLTALNPRIVFTGNVPVSIVFDPLNRYAYVTNSDESTVSMYSLDQNTGLLAPLKPSTVPSGNIPVGIVVATPGNVLYNIHKIGYK